MVKLCSTNLYAYLRTEGSIPTDSSLSLPIVMTVTPADPTHGASPVDWVRRVGTSALKVKHIQIYMFPL